MSLPPSPWRFLTSLDEHVEADRRLIALSRAEELQSITDMVASSRASILYAASGNGKSSVLNAGVIPFFRQRGYEVYKTRPRPPCCTSDPCLAFKKSIMENYRAPIFSARDIGELRAAVTNQAKGSESKDGSRLGNLELSAKVELLAKYAPSMGEHLAEYANGTLLDFVQGLSKVLRHGKPMLFVCDQFEELFVHFTNRSSLSQFADELGAVWADSTLNLRLLFSLREDWVGSMIEFRRSIPSIFASYYKLEPLKRSHAHHALQQPLNDVGSEFTFTEDAIEAILDDLVKSYAEVRVQRTWGTLAPSAPGEEAFIELPALQILAEELWMTRAKHPRPFSRQHYAELPRLGGMSVADRGSFPADQGSATNGSIADIVLSSYLEPHLTDQSEQDLKVRRFYRELRLDCLYLLTDGLRHRRALPEPFLVEQVNRLRQANGESERVSLEIIRSALEKLRAARVIIEFPGDEVQIELAHDFAVRVVVSSWRQLERQRLASIAVKAEEQKVREQAYSGLEKLQRRLHYWWSILPTANLLCCICYTFVILDMIGRYSERWLSETVAACLGFFAAILGIATGAGALLISLLQAPKRLRIVGYATFGGSLLVGFSPLIFGDRLDSGEAKWILPIANMVFCVAILFLRRRFRAEVIVEEIPVTNAFLRRLFEMLRKYDSWIILGLSGFLLYLGLANLFYLSFHK